mgnify:FL=1
MSLYGDASILMFPSGYKEDKLYSLKPTDGTGDLSFARSSSATRVNEQGLIEEYLLGSELITNGDFATNLNFWSTSSWWVWNALGAYHPSATTHKPLYQQCAVIGKQYYITFDINIVSGKAKFSLGSSTGSTTQVIANNLQTGSYSYLVTAAAEYIVFNRQQGFNAEFYVDNVSVKEAQTNNVPRIDYTGGGCGKLLIEPQRTNYFPESNNVYPTASSKTANATSSPEGLENASLYVENTATTSHGAIKTAIFPTLGNTTYTFSVFAKAKERKFLKMSLYANSAITNAQGFDLENGTVTDSDSSIEDFGNGWYKCTTTKSINNSTGGYNFAAIYTGTDATTYFYQGDGTSGFYLYGFQLEQGDFASSYIPTSGTTVTRTQDTSLTTSSNIAAAINSEEGVQFIDFDRFDIDGQVNSFTLARSFQPSNNYIIIAYRTDRILGYIRSNGVYQTTMVAYGTWTMPRIKVAFKWKVNDFALWINGVEVKTDTSGTTFAANSLDTIIFSGATNQVNQQFNARINAIAVYDTALSDEDLTTLTTL